MVLAAATRSSRYAFSDKSACRTPTFVHRHVRSFARSFSAVVFKVGSGFFAAQPIRPVIATRHTPPTVRRSTRTSDLVCVFNRRGSEEGAECTTSSEPKKMFCWGTLFDGICNAYVCLELAMVRGSSSKFYLMPAPPQRSCPLAQGGSQVTQSMSTGTTCRKPNVAAGLAKETSRAPLP